MKITAQGLERMKELYNDPVARELIKKAQFDLIDVLNDWMKKHKRRLADHIGGGNVETEIRLIGLVFIAATAYLIELNPKAERQNFMDMASDCWDMIKSGITDEDLFADRKPS